MPIRLREPVNSLTHLAGAVLSIIGLIFLVYRAIKFGSVWHIISFSIYGTSLILLFTSSTLYHSLPISPRGLVILRRIDHMMIYVLIAGSYTPFCLVPLNGPWGWSMLSIVWALAISGIILKIFWMHAPRLLYTTAYVLMGCIAFVAIVPLVETLSLGALVWLILGGVFYFMGALIYGLKWPNFFPGVFGFHEIWHCFVLAGSFSHFWVVSNYIVHIHV